MMFSIRNLVGTKYLAIVTATSYETPLSEISEITKSLKEQYGLNSEGEVFFDLLCSNGLEFNRFLTMFFDGQDLRVETARVLSVSDVEDSIKKAQTSFFRQSEEILNNSILTADQIRQILCGR